jgi:hypothetical protein
MTDRSIHRIRTRRVVVLVAAAGIAVGLSSSAALVAATDEPADPVQRDRVQIAEWAKAEHLSGLSPASMSSTSAAQIQAELEAIAEWARANGLTGLSPASLASVDDDR